MDIPLEIWLRGDNHATSTVISPVRRDPRAWNDEDVTAVLMAMLRALDRARHPGSEGNRPIALRGFSWIVNPYEEGGVVIALELTLGAVVAGPFDVSEKELTTLIEHVMSAERATMHRGSSPTVH
jgi:hypothetical protein